MKRSISPLALLFASVSAILGSGWLFASYFTTTLAGPSALISWTLGGVISLVIAFIFAENCSMIPVSGSSARLPQFTHGSIVSFIFAWMIWLAYIALMSTEAQATLQYVSLYIPDIVKNGGGLTHYGYIAAAVILLLISAINTYSLRWLVRSNNILTIFKIVIPLAVALSVLAVAFHHHRLSLSPFHSAFAPGGFHGIFAAISTGGIVFAFTGFRLGAELAGEVKNPKVAIPLSIVGSILLCLVLFLLLQWGFLAALTPKNLVHGWAHLHLAHANSPMVAILVQQHLTWLIPVLSIGAIIAPLAAGLMYCSSASRALYGLSKNGSLPALFKRLSPHGNPIYAIILNFIIGLCLFAPLPGWDKMVTFLTSLLAITYVVGPVSFLVFRKQLPHYKRPIKLPFGHVWAFAAFYLCTVLAYWCGWATLSKLGIAVVLGLLVLFSYYWLSERGQKMHLNWKSSIWIWPYFIGLSFFSYIGNYGGGQHWLSQSAMLLSLLIFSVIICYLAYRFCLPKKITSHYIHKVTLEEHSDS